MNDYLKELKKYKEFKEIKDIVEDAIKLNELYNAEKHNEMLEHIRNLMNKYFVETLTWNSINRVMPQTIEQQYINANDFLKAQSVKILIEKGVEVSKELLGENK